METAKIDVDSGAAEPNTAVVDDDGATALDDESERTTSLAGLDERLNALQGVVETLIGRLPDPAAGGTTVDGEAASASRTLMMAERTAEAVVADAKTEAARILAEAEASRDQIAQRARDAAEAEFAAQREAVANELAIAEARKLELSNATAMLNARLMESIERLAEADRVLRETVQISSSSTSTEFDVVPPDVQQVAPQPEQQDQPDELQQAEMPAPPTSPVTDPMSSPAAEPTDPVTNEPARAPSFYRWSDRRSPAVAPAPTVADPADPSGNRRLTPPGERRGLFGH